ncbi:MAG TPA: response regulator, partial [Burkholderiaceae bacterium]|nr:response regulator [Burkholderiaceae bacterium]
EVELEEADAHVDTLALRFACSRGMTELLARAASVHAPHEQRVRGAQQRITQLAEESLAHALAGNARGAVKALVAHGASTANTKLIDTARGTLARYRDRIDDADDLAGVIDALRARYAPSAVAPPLGHAQGRATGGVALRAAA